MVDMERIKLDYFTPPVEELRVGYECETLVVEFGVDGNDFSLYSEKWRPTVMDWYEVENVLHAFGTGRMEIRTPYLTHSQIVKEGWKCEDNEMRTSYHKGDLHLFYSFETRELILSNAGRTLFRGTCLCINTLRYISKLVGL